MTDLLIHDFNYDLPDNCIAKYPLSKRDESKLLVYKDRKIIDSVFNNCLEYLPSDSFLIFNNTKVIKARLFFRKETGSIIEIFCLEPSSYQENSDNKVWTCLIGNNKKWKTGKLYANLNVNNRDFTLSVERLQNEQETWQVRFDWDDPQLNIFDIFEIAGEMPLPPYLNRNAEKQDEQTYQTVYARHEGSVAAPTAGLHFTDELLAQIKSKSIETDFVTLHVGAGTFKPVTSSKITNHNMHIEHIEVHIDLLKKILKNKDKTIIPVGTTSMRTVESLYWLGAKNLLTPHNELVTELGQWDAYQDQYNTPDFSLSDALQTIINKMEKLNLKTFMGQTQIMIHPGYRFRIAKGIFTNFHQPQSTLLLLISALVGNDWKEIYQHALNNQYRFLSYGDACLFLP